jgi:type II secretory pathway pseudopilin PulG
MFTMDRSVRSGKGRLWARRQGGFTLTELTTTTAAVAVLLAVSLSALTHNREGERTAACLTNLKRLGHAISMYTADFQGTLPGPTQVAVPWNTAWNTGRTYLAGDATSQTWYRRQLTWYLAPYVGRGDSDPQPADLLPFCPSADAIAVVDASSQPMVVARPRSYYMLNTIGWSSDYAFQGSRPYYPRSRAVALVV